MSGISFNPNINTTPAEVYNETPANGTDATQRTQGKPTLTQVSSTASETAGVSLETATSLPAPDAYTQANAGPLAETAMGELSALPPGSGVASNAIKDMSALTGSVSALATLAATPGADPKAVAELAGKVETQAGSLAAALRDVVTNSTYPDFTSVLKDLMNLAQQLKEAASQVKMAAIEGKYDLQMAGADKLREAAHLDAASREKNIKAENTQAWATLGTSVAGAAVSYGGIGKTFEQSFSTIGQSINQGGGAVGTLVTTGQKLQASTDQLNADLLRADKAQLDADATMQDASIQTVDEIEEAAKKLREAAMQALSTMASNHAQIMRSAVEV